MDTHPQPITDDKYIVGLRFQRVGKIYHFDASNIRDLKPGDYAVVDTSRGRQLGQMIYVVNQPDPNADSSLKPVIRRATPQDLLLKKSWEQKEVEALIYCQQKAAELGYKDVKIIVAEFSFDGTRLFFLYSSEEGEKTDLKSLRRALQKLYIQTRIEMHMIGPRDVAKIMGGMGACGLDMRCCSAFLADFCPISIKMAKEQGISLTPTEITGMCGRLRCCMGYEYPQYVEARKKLPKRGKRVNTPKGLGKITDVLALKGSALVELDSGGQYEFSAQELQPSDEQELVKKMTGNIGTAQANGDAESRKRGKRRQHGEN
jgi:cell fate regulator YaaT (PSP1 superfamily)